MKINNTHNMTKNGVVRKNPPSKQVKVARYRWGEYAEDVLLSLKTINNIKKEHQELDGDILLGFYVRDADYEKTFYADEYDIDENDEGVSVKNAYAF